MTPKNETLARRAAVLIAAAAAPLLVAGPAGADVPEGWSNPEPVSALEALVLLAGVPLLLIVLIAAAVYVPALVRGERVAPGTPPAEDLWFGGPRHRGHELAPGGDTADSDATGGASGRW